MYCPLCRQELVTGHIGGRDRSVCPSDECDYVKWDNPIPVVAAIVELNGKIVLTRNKGWSERWYGLVAGFLECGETPEKAVLREIQEELGLAADIADFVGYYSFFERNQIILAFHVLAEGEITLGDELADAWLVEPEEVHPWKIGTGPALRDWLKGRGIRSVT
jgi:NAD+ diphosphatase